MPRKTPPFVRDPELKRALNDVYIDINNILLSIEPTSENSLHSSTGRVGDIKAIKDSLDGSYKIAGKTRYGWISTPAYLQKGNKGRKFYNPEFNLSKNDILKYDQSILNILSPNSPSLRLGSSSSEMLEITSVFSAGTQELNYVSFSVFRNKAETVAIKLNNNGNLIIRESAYSESRSDTKILVHDKDETGWIRHRTIQDLVTDVGAATISNNADNRVITGGSGTALNGEANLTFDGTDLIIASTGKLAVGDNATYVHQVSDSNLAVVADGDITLNANGGNVDIYDDTARHFSFDCDDTSLRIFDDTAVADYFKIKVDANGLSTISTNDNDGSEGSIVLDADGAIILDSNGKFSMKKDGTEFSVVNSSFAGMILGYRMIGEDPVAAHSGNLGTSFAVVSDDATVRFVAPPSGAVEVSVQVYIVTSSNAEVVEFALSTTDTTSYTPLGTTYEQLVSTADRSDDGVIHHSWVVTGLTAGNTYNYWLAAEATTGTTRLYWGGTATSNYPDFIMKVTALPKATSDFAEYD